MQINLDNSAQFSVRTALVHFLVHVNEQIVQICHNLVHRIKICIEYDDWFSNGYCREILVYRDILLQSDASESLTTCLKSNLKSTQSIALN